MDFVLTTIAVIGGDRLRADFDIRHATESMRGSVSVTIKYAMTDTLAQIAVRARETLERAIEEI
jgi:hypothetical protein